MKNPVFEGTNEQVYSLGPYDQQQTRGLRIGVVGISFKTAPIPVREEIARKITIEELWRVKKAYLEGDDELVLLSTCNRAEIYFATKEFDSTSRVIEQLFSLEKFISGSDFQTYFLRDSGAIGHLFEVATGLDSLVIGESQILLQVKDASRTSSEAGLCGPVLTKLFHKSYNSGREIRQSYPELAGRSKESVSSSVASLISKYCDEKFKSFEPNVLLVGSGKMIRLAINSIDRSKLGSLIVASRRSKVDGVLADSVPLADISETIYSKKVDIIITATSSENYIISSKELKPALIQRTSRPPLLIIDISVPRNVDPTVSAECGVMLYNIDDLKNLLPDAELEFKAVLPSISRALSEKRDEFLTWMDQRSTINPILNSLRRKAEAIRGQELGNAFDRLPDITPEERLVIEKMSDRIIRRFLDMPSNRLKEALKQSDELKVANYTNVIAEIFSLESEETLEDVEADSLRQEIIEATEEQ
ncbi:MAG: glutamyl-tRNA reductase [Nitrososphaerota archaeon]|nr:glutamyl-tRNA reductase [Nitrososphaerota archaeon]